MNSLSTQELLENFIETAKTTLSGQEIENLYRTEADAFYPRDLIANRNLRGYTEDLWTNLSIKNYSTSKDFRSFGDTSVAEILLRLALKDLPKANMPIEYQVFLIGDYPELMEMIELIKSTTFHIQGIELNWKAMCPDIHENINTNIKSMLKSNNLNVDRETFYMSTINSTFDDDMDSNSLAGLDGSGMLNTPNLMWIEKNSIEKKSNESYHLVYGALQSVSYLDVSPTMIKLYLRLALSVLSSLDTMGIGILKIPIPHNLAMRGIYSLYSMLFQNTKIVRFKHESPDNPTVYLIGIHKISHLNGLVQTVLGSETSTDSLLHFLGSQNTLDYSTINDILRVSFTEWVNKLSNVWIGRNH